MRTAVPLMLMSVLAFSACGVSTPTTLKSSPTEIEVTSAWLNAGAPRLGDAASVPAGFSVCGLPAGQAALTPQARQACPNL